MQATLLSPDTFARFAKMVYDRAGIFLPEEKRSLLSNRLRSRLRVLKIESFEEYYDRFGDAEFAEEEMPFFLNSVTTNETYFFRNERLWALFEEKLLPEIVAANSGKGRTFKVWSAAASSGEEAYTVAILLRELLPNFASWRAQVIGTDISRKVLEKAGKGLYNDYAVSKMKADRRERWFTRDGENYQLQDEVRKLVRFQFHNLRDPMTPGGFDLVLLRNVLMYFDTAVKQTVIRHACEAVASGGFLYIGDVDPTRTSKELMEVMTLTPLTPGLYQKPQRQVFGRKEA